MSLVDKLREKSVEGLHAHAKGLGVEVQTQPDPEDPEREIPHVPDREDLVEKVLLTHSIEDLKALPEVKKHKRVRLNKKQDVVDAALGRPTEQERENAARELAESENDAAPTAEEVQKLNAPPEVEITLDDVGLVEKVMIRRWVQGEDGRPVRKEVRRR